MNMVDFDLPIINDNIPSTYKAAIHIPENGDQWKKSMGEEINSLYKNQTWDSVPLPKGEKEIGCKWVYSKKEWPMSKDDIRFKARLVTKGYTQTEGIDYNEVNFHLNCASFGSTVCFGIGSIGCENGNATW